MITIKLIDLLNKIANGEEVPKSFVIDSVKYYVDDSGMIQRHDGKEVRWFIYRRWLNKEVEIPVDVFEGSTEEKK